MNMNANQKKQQQLNRGIAVAVAILLALTLIVTIIAFSAGKRSENTTASTKGTSVTQKTNSTLNTTGRTQSTSGSHTSPEDPDKPGDNTDDKPTAAVIPEFICPVNGNLVKDYSADIPVFSLTMEDYRVHCGIDIGAEAGTDVMAAADGKISKVFYDPMMGQTVEITHDGGYVSVYKNLRTKLPVGTVEGASVSAGDVIGYVGDTALVEISDSPHLHFEIIKDEEFTNPLSQVTLPESDDSENYED